jgi:hypothetical protein
MSTAMSDYKLGTRRRYQGKSGEEMHRKTDEVDVNLLYYI